MNTTSRLVCLFLALALAACSGGVDTASRPTADGAPRLVAGQTNAAFTEADGGEGSLDSIFIALHPTLLPQRPPAPAPGP